MSPPAQWQQATWQDYVALRDAPTQERMKLAFNQGWLWVAMGGEGINHAGVSDLFTSLLFLWAIQHPEQLFTSLGRCLLEKPETQACAHLDEQKHLYASLSIPEYWVVDVRGQRVFAFLLQENGEYQICEESRALAGLPIALLEEALQRLSEGTNTSAAAWFTQQIAKLSARDETL